MIEDESIYGITTEDINFNLKKLDLLLGYDKIDLHICLIGGTACLLTGLIHRATIDYDLLNLNYSPRVRNYLNFFNPYDLVDFEATTIPRSYGNRTKDVFVGEYLRCSILSIEDIIMSKLCRNLEKDFKDIDALIQSAHISIIKELILEVSEQISDRYPRIQENYKLSLETFYNRYNITLEIEGE